MKSRKALYIVSSAVCLIVALGVIAWMVRDELNKSTPEAVSQEIGERIDDISEQRTNARQNDPGTGDATQDMAAVEKEEAAYTIKTKSEAVKALGDMDGLVQSAGDTSF